MALSLIVLGVGARAALTHRDAYGLTRPPMMDDSYYDQSYARAIAEGNFFSINGVDPGNAYHPLYNVTISPIYRLVSDDLWALRLVVFVHLVMALLSGALAYFSVRTLFQECGLPNDHEFALLAVGLYAINAVAYAADMNLMQTGIQLLLMWAIVLQAVRRGSTRWRAWILFGLTFALACLGRIDGMFLVAGYGLVLLVQRRLPFAAALTMFLPPALAIAGWLIIGHQHTGFWLPTGGSANWAPFGWRRLVENVGHAAGTLSYMLLAVPKEPPFWPLWWVAHALPRNAVVFSTLVAVAWAWVFTLRRMPDLRRRLRSIAWKQAPLIGGLLLLVAAYLPNFGAPYFFQRYFSVWLPLIVIGWTIWLGGLWASGRRWPVRIAVSLFACLFVASLERIAVAPSDMWSSLAAIHGVDENSWIASGETGVLGFYHRRTLNLDGKTNAHALRALRAGTLDRYILQQRPEWIVDRLGYTFGTFTNNPHFLDTYERLGATYPVVWRLRQ